MKDGTNKKNYLSLQTKVELTENELRAYVIQYASDHQLNPDTLAIFVEDYMGFLTRHASYAEQNRRNKIKIPFESGDKVFVISEQQLATVLDVYGDGINGDHGDIRLDLCGNTSIDDIQHYDPVLHSEYDHTFLPIKKAWRFLVSPFCA